MTFRGGGQSVVRREEGSGQPFDCTMTVHIDSKRGTYSIAFDIQTKTTVTLTGPGSPPTHTPNTAGVAFESKDLPLPAGNDVIRGHALFEPHKTPVKTDFVAIDFAAIARGYAAQREANSAGGLPTPYSLTDELANTVAHELAHACGAAHHGDRENEGPTRQLDRTNVPPRYTVIGTDGVEITTRTHTVKNPDGTETTRDYLELKGQVAGDDSRSSGDLNCIMCYPNHYAWRLSSIRGKGYVWRAMMPLPMGTTLCTGRDGNPPNVHFGPANASRGNCRAKIKIKDE